MTIAWAAGADISPLFADYRISQGEVWRLVTSAFPHVGILHLLFNLYWLWVFGSLVEGAFGHIRTAGIYLFLAVGSAGAEYAFSSGGVGLSGVGYGLFGLLWVLSRWDERFRGAIDRNTIALFIAWFFVCIALTIAKIMPIGNVAHGMGAIQGILLGFAVALDRRRPVVIAGLVCLMLAVTAAATLGRPYVNFSSERSDELAYEGYVKLTEDRSAENWFNLGIAYGRVGRTSDAVRAYGQAAKQKPKSKRYRHIWLATSAYEQQTGGDVEAAVKLYREALDVDGREASTWYNLGTCCEILGQRDDARSAFEKAVSIDPNNAQFRAALRMEGGDR